jgi:hypothetical protein
MKRITILFTALLLTALTVSAKNIKVTIDGTVESYVSRLYLIVNEDTANAQLVPIQDGKFSVTVKVDRESLIRLHDSKEWPERAFFVIYPDSKHITVDMRTGTIEGSVMSNRLNQSVNIVRKAGPGNFHIDVFSEDKAAWEEARAREKAIRANMEAEQRTLFQNLIRENRYNNIPVWLTYCFPYLVTPDFMAEVTKEIEPEWMQHPILKARKK